LRAGNVKKMIIDIEKNVEMSENDKG